MNLKKRSWIPWCAASIVIACASGCVNEQYDLSKGIDMTIGADVNISVPVGSTEFIEIGDFLKIEESENNMIFMDETTGDYYLSFAGKEPFSTTIEVPEINLGTTQSEEVKVKLDIRENAQLKDFIGEPIGKDLIDLIGRSEFEYDIPPTTQMPIIIDEELPEQVKDIRKINLNTAINFNFSISEGATSLSDIVIAFPKFMTVEATQTGLTVKNGHEVTINDPLRIESGKQPSVSIIIKEIDFDKMPVGMGIVSVDGKNRVIIGTDSQPVSVDVSGKIKIDLYDFSQVPAEVGVIMDISLDQLVVGSAEVKIDASETVEDQNIEVGELPEFLTSNNVVLDVYNPVIRLDVNNGSPLAASLDADINAFIGEESTLDSPIHIGANGNPGTKPISISPNTDASIFVSRRGEHDNPQPGDIDIAVPAIADLIKTVPEKLTISNIVVDADSDSYLSVSPGESYECAVAYGVSAWMAFGPDLLIEYSTDIKDLNEALNPGGDGETSGEGQEQGGLDYEIDLRNVEIKFNLHNSIPLNVALKAEPIDVEGNVMEDVEVKLTGDVKSGSAENPAVCPMAVNLKATLESIKTFDGIKLTIKGTSSEETVGVVLNSKQGIQLTDVSAKVSAGATINNLLGE
ncbi:MAG: hypothetical protein IAB91_00370 [Bacteroidetes bacterium]|uniref:Uncharacterized protein n=1 Tax=Candidatus Cryptobacteroides faecigallinarum TaxID=2840763 RepID=A0A9D9NHK8_9BACT|nr:hypothetical protein [Candidatus Cryptobacteroides faecigallinarum]